MADNAALANIIRTKLAGVRPEDQDIVLEDSDWNLILSSLTGDPAQGTATSLRDAVDRIVVSAMSWQPSENGPSFDSKFTELMARFDAALAAQPPAAPVETDALGVIESDRLFAEQILADFGAFEEGITDKEKLAQWIRNVRRASSTPDDPHLQSSSADSKLALIRSIVVSATIEAGEDLGPTASAAIAWRTIGELRRVLGEEISAPNLIIDQPQILSVSEEERHAIEHARYQIDQASILYPDCCFDMDLVKDLVRALDRAYPLTRPHQHTEENRS